MFFYIVLTPISTTSGLWSTGNTRKYHQIEVYIYQCADGIPERIWKDFVKNQQRQKAWKITQHAKDWYRKFTLFVKFLQL